MQEIIGLLTLLVAIIICIRNPYQKDERYEQELDSRIEELRTKAKTGIPLSFEERALLSSRLRSFN